MYLMRKLKPDRSVTGLIPAIVSLTIFFILLILIGYHVALYFLSAVFLLYALYSFTTYLKTRNSGYIIVVLYQISAALFFVTAPIGIEFASSPWSRIFMVVILFFASWLLYLVFNKKIDMAGA